MVLKVTSRSFYSGLTEYERERLQIFLGHRARAATATVLRIQVVGF